MSASSKVGSAQSSSFALRAGGAARERGSFTQRLRADCRGLTTVEYVIVLCLIASVAVGTWRTFGESVNAYLQRSKDRIDQEMKASESQGDKGPGE